MAPDIDRAPAVRKAGPKARRRRGPPRATPEFLRRAGLRYLERYAASAAHLRRLLRAKVERSARAHGTERAEGLGAVEAVIAELKRAGLLDDARYAEAKAEALHRRGASARAIRGALAAKGVAPELVARALARLGTRTPEPDLAAALAYARRRKLGPYRPGAERAAHRARDLAALGRRGFDYEIARRVVEAPDAAQLEAEAGPGPGGSG